jgi:hypothetical protein
MPRDLIPSRRWLIILPLVVLTPALCGCLPEQQQRLKCEFEFLQTKADTTLSGAAAPAFVAACMERHGYIWHSSEPGCELQNECYVPRWQSWFLRLLFDRGPSLPGV